MKALLLKDCYILFKPMKLLILIVAVIAFMPQVNMAAFAVVYMSVLSVSILSYDERSKWNTLAAMMPYTPKQLVGSKYIMAAGLTLAAMALSLLGSLIITPDEFTATLATVSACAAVGLLVIAVQFPLMYKMGTEKGRMFLMLFTVLVVILAMGISFLGLRDLSPSDGALAVILAAAFAVSLILLFISFLLSIHIYKNKKI